MSNLTRLKNLLKERRTEIGTVIKIEQDSSPVRYKVKTPFGIVTAQTFINDSIKVNDVVKIQNQIIIGRSRLTSVPVYYV